MVPGRINRKQYVHMCKTHMNKAARLTTHGVIIGDPPLSQGCYSLDRAEVEDVAHDVGQVLGEIICAFSQSHCTCVGGSNVFHLRPGYVSGAKSLPEHITVL
jgi:hypothetical protein